MLPVTPLPTAGEVLLDTRGDGRALRVSWHSAAEAGTDVVVLSLWAGGTCTGTFRLAVEDVPVLVEALRDGLGRSYAAAVAQSSSAQSSSGPGSLAG